MYADFPALAIVIILSLLLMRSTKESSQLNIVVVGIHLLLIIFVICAGKKLWDLHQITSKLISNQILNCYFHYLLIVRFSFHQGMLI